jgi:hypothetical protein
MIKLPVKGKILAILISAFILYFYSESVLRQGAVSSIDSGKLNKDSLLSELPGALRDEVDYRITYMQLQEYIRTARTDAQKATALSNMADFIKDPAKRAELFLEVYKNYPNIPQALRAYVYFLENNSSREKVSIADFVAYIQTLSVYDRYYALSLGFTKLRDLNVSLEKRYEFLKHLLKTKPEFREYSNMYALLADICSQLNKQEEYKLAIELEKTSLSSPMLETMYVEEMEQKRKETLEADQSKQENK